jgi:hypothetical protein
MFAKQRDRSLVVAMSSGPPHVDRMALLLATVAPLVGFLFLVRPPLILPSISAVAVASAAMIALTAWWTSSDRDSRGISLWDVSGAYAFIGFAAGTVSDPHELVEFFSLRAEMLDPLQ